MRRCDFDQTFELQSQPKTVCIVDQAKQLQNPFFPNNIGDGTLPQAIPGGTGTRPKVGGAHERFRSHLIAIYCDRRGVDRTAQTSFFHAVYTR